jgi:hypothetical protein
VKNIRVWSHFWVHRSLWIHWKKRGKIQTYIYKIKEWAGFNVTTLLRIAKRRGQWRTFCDDECVVTRLRPIDHIMGLRWWYNLDGFLFILLVITVFQKLSCMEQFKELECKVCQRNKRSDKIKELTKCIIFKLTRIAEKRVQWRTFLCDISYPFWPPSSQHLRY